MNRHYDPTGEELVETDGAPSGSQPSMLNAKRWNKTGPSDIELLRNVIRHSVFERARQQIAEKRMIEIEQPDFPQIAIRDFSALLMQPGSDYVRADAIARLSNIGTTVLERALFLEAVARDVGRRWSEDNCNFVDTTIIAARLQYFVHLLKSEIPFIPERKGTPVVMIVHTPDEHHTLMCEILGLLYASLGWRRTIIASDSPFSNGSLSPSEVDIICLACSSAHSLEATKKLAACLREECEGQRPVVMAGGPAAQSHVNELLALGVDCICDNVYSAINISQRYISLCNSNHKLDEARGFLTSSIPMDERVYE